MKCQYVAFKLELGPGISKTNVVAELVKHDKESVVRGKRERFFQVAKRGPYVLGRWACLKGRKKQVIADAKTKEFIWHSLPEGYEITAPNYFVIHTQTLHGLYQRYSGSNSLQDFGDLLVGIAKRITKPARQGEVQAAKAKANVGRKVGDKVRQLPNADKTRIDGQFLALFSPIIRREKLDEILNRWNAINGLKYRVATLQPSSNDYGPLADHTHAVVYELRLSSKSKEQVAGQVRAYGATIASMYGWLKDRYRDRLKRTALIGKDEHGSHRTVDLGKFVDWLDEEDVDQAITDTELEGIDMLQSPLLKKMISMCDERPAYFHKEAR